MQLSPTTFELAVLPKYPKTFGSLYFVLILLLYFLSTFFKASPANFNPSHQLWCVIGYLLGIFLLFSLYSSFCRLAASSTDAYSKTSLLFWILPALFTLLAIFLPPVFSEDLWAYLSSGYYSNLPNGNTYLHAAWEIPTFPVAAEFARVGIIPKTGITPYGPTWSIIELVLFRAAPNLRIAALLLKLFVGIAVFASTWLIWDTVRLTDPANRFERAVCFLWNPLILMEFPIEGHNDIWMIFWILSALNLAIRRKPLLGIAALWIGVLCKFIPVIFAMPLIVHFCSQNRDFKTRLQFAISAFSLCALMAIALYMPFWIGVQTFSGLGDMRGKSQVTISYWIERVLSFVIDASQAAAISSIFVDVGFAAFIVWQSLKARDNGSLLNSCLNISVCYLFFNSKRFWPWYPDLTLALSALSGGPLSHFLSFTLPLTTRLVAPMSPLRNAGWISTRAGGYYFTLFGVLIPTLILIWIIFGKWRAKGENSMSAVQQK